MNKENRDSLLGGLVLGTIAGLVLLTGYTCTSYLTTNKIYLGIKKNGRHYSCIIEEPGLASHVNEEIRYGDSSGDQYAKIKFIKPDLPEPFSNLEITVQNVDIREAAELAKKCFESYKTYKNSQKKQSK